VRTPALCLTYVAGAEAARVAEVRRQTKETRVLVSVNLDGTGVCTSNSQIPFLDHMMDVRPDAVLHCLLCTCWGCCIANCPCCYVPVTFTRVPCSGCCLVGDVLLTALQLSSAPCTAQQLASHGLFNVIVEAEGDTWIDDHHTNEDIGTTCSGKLAFVVIECDCHLASC